MNIVTATSARCRIGIDVGGTFTDFVLADLATGRLTFYKEPSTPSEASEAVERGIKGLIARAGVRPQDIELLVHGTTLGLNTIIQRKGAKIALVVSRGNRDVMEIARSRLPSSYDLRVVKEASLVPRDLVYEISARTLVNGTIDERPGNGEIAALAGRLEAAQVDAVAVMLLNSYLHPQLEREVAGALRAALPDLLVTASAELWPEIREYERALIATLNAYIHPLIDAYLGRLRSRLAAIDITAPIYVTGNNGGTIGIATAKERPIDTVLSGPASGVVAGSRLAALSGDSKIITFDMGGTSSDIAVSRDRTPEYSTRTSVGDFPLILPVVNVSAIGAGGGSIVWVDPQGVLKVGPHSAGADPGPICYGKGGKLPTITDCYLAIGLLRPDGFLGGRMTLDREAVIDGLTSLADKVGFTGPDRAVRVAEAALQVATAKMATELYKHFAQRGLDPREFTLIAYGGAGPTQANFLAEEVRLPAILIPPSPGTLCALGAIVTDLKRDYVRTIRRQLSADGGIGRLLRDLSAELEAEANVWLVQEGEIVGPVSRHWTADLRYAGEAQELTVTIPQGAVERGAIDDIAEAFHHVHETVYGFRDTETSIDLTTLRNQVVGGVPAIELPTVPAATRAAKPVGTRRVFNRGGWVDAAVFRREDLRAGDCVAGPALIEQEDTTIWVLANWNARTDGNGILRVERV